MKEGKQPHILNASSNLIGICFLIITSIKLTGNSNKSLADEISIAAMLFLLVSCLLSYLSIRAEKISDTLEKIADYSFILGLFFLSTGVIILSFAII